MKKKYIIYIIFIIVLFGGIDRYMLTNQNKCYKRHLYTNEIDLDREISKENIVDDRNQIIEILESVHPIFLEEYPYNYAKAKRKFIKRTNRCMTIGEFQISLSKYLSSIEDKHTAIGWIPSTYLDINWKYIDNKLVILDENNQLTEKVVININDVKIDKIIKEVDEIFSSENTAGDTLNRSEMSKLKLVLMSAGVDCSEDILLTIKADNKETKENVEFETEKTCSGELKQIYSEMIDDITMYIKLETCSVNDQLYEVLDYINLELSRGLENVIVDVRDNGGGTSEAIYRLLDTLKFEYGDFGGVVRYSELAHSMYPDLKKEGYNVFPRDNSASKNEDINLFVITNEKTFSSAQWLATLVKDGNLGTIVGKPSSNKPSSFGDALIFTLNNSGIYAQVSYKKWLRPDETKDSEPILEPDIYVEDWENPIDRILKLIDRKYKKES